MAGVQVKRPSLPLLLLLFLLFVVARGEDGATDANSGACLNTTELIKKHGYAVERHEVLSQTGYILALFRISLGRNCSQPGEPLLLMHGFLSDSDAWMQLGNHSLPFLAVAACYDVWLGDGRGNKYSRNHTSLDPNKLEFWLWSWHEQGVYDLPAIIDHILNATGKSSLSYVGHSMGTTMLLVMASERPQYVQRVRLAILLSPVSYMGNTPNPLIRTLAPAAPLVAAALVIPLHGELPVSNLTSREWTNSTEAHVLAAVVGEIRRIWTHNASSPAVVQFPDCPWSNGSLRQSEHFAQEISSGHFRKFDFGALRNLNEYGTTFPPDYDLTKVSCSTIAWYSNGDELVSTKDVARLAEDTPANVLFRMVPDDGFGHSDFLSSEKAHPLIYLPTLAALRGEDIGASKNVNVSTEVGTTGSPAVRLSAPTERGRSEERKKKEKRMKKAKKSAGRAHRSTASRADRHPH